MSHPATPSPPSAKRRRGGAIARFLPLGIVALAVLYVASALRPPADERFHVSRFGEIPVVDLGRLKPIDTLARTSLMVLSNKQAMYLSETHGTSDRADKRDGSKVSASRWLLDVMARPERAREYEVIRIDHPDVLGLMGVEHERKYFSFNEVMQHQQAISTQIDRARMVDSSDLTSFQRAILRLSRQLGLYFDLEETVNLLLIPPVRPGDEWQSIASARQASMHAAHAHGADDPAAHAMEEENPAVDSFIAILRGWHDQQPAQFNAAVEEHIELVEAELPKLAGQVSFETFFNRTAPFMRAMGLYVLVFVLVAISWLRGSRWLLRAAFWVMIVALAVHTYGLVARILIQGRPPVTNLYSSAIFVGWGITVLAIFLERIYKNGIGAVSAATCGFLSLLVAHNLSLDGDTMTMMQAVLDTNFWLATHVIVITLGYASTFLAGFLGILYVLRGVFTRSLDRPEARNLGRMIYGIVCFATLFSFVGTILGGIWADQSWGRFWGWDPKENGALLIVLWNALILHARWGGLVRERGLALLAIGGNIVTAWSWFGTNMLGVGLHSYGFMDSALFWLIVFVLTQLGLIGLGLLPPSRWRSHQAAGGAPEPGHATG
ncbi:MAG: cytochrome c biogenesis protein CcsA [Candidatus Eiseniibacteriota bacterium]|jgi:ABC-type transport system involved in cytochrome c biogenesis permease subunit